MSRLDRGCVVKYQDRPSYYFVKFIQELLSRSVASQMGLEVFALLVVIGQREDKSRYSGPVGYWNGQLMEQLGFKSPKQLNNARDAAIKAGYLSYHREHDRAIGKYFVHLPEETSVPLGEHEPESKTEHETESVPNTERELEQKPESEAEHETESLLSLLPDTSVPKKKSGFAAEASPLPLVLDSVEFRKAWSDWVRHRREIKKPLTRTQVKKQQEAFAELGAERSISQIAHTIRQGWQGLRDPERGSIEGLDWRGGARNGAGAVYDRSRKVTTNGF